MLNVCDSGSGSVLVYLRNLGEIFAPDTRCVIASDIIREPWLNCHDGESRELLSSVTPSNGPATTEPGHNRGRIREGD
jgi:hypothetical protein